jgi:hypothetical protein
LLDRAVGQYAKSQQFCAAEALNEKTTQIAERGMRPRCILRALANMAPTSGAMAQFLFLVISSLSGGPNGAYCSQKPSKTDGHLGNAALISGREQ